MKARRAAAPAVALAVSSWLLAAAPASAATDPGDGLWYLTATGVEEVHAQTTGEGITIAVIDGPVNPAAPDLVGANLVVRPSFCRPQDGVTPTETSDRPDAEHATGSIALLIGTGAGVDGQPGIRGVAPGATVLSYSVYPPDWVEGSVTNGMCVDEDGVANDIQALTQSIDDAVAQGADIISMSSGGIWLPENASAVARAYAAGTIIVAAAQNGAGFGFPGTGNGVVMVEMSDSAMQLDPDPETTSHPYLGVVAPGEDLRWYDASAGRWDSYTLGDGTSLATAWTAGAIALAWSLHPEATGNQMIQSLIHTTAVGDDFGHDDQWGYGPVAVHQLVADDPTQYPDENPFLRPVGMTEGPEGLPVMPPTQEVLDAIAAASGSSAPSATPEPGESQEPGTTAGDRPATAKPGDTPSAAGPIALGVGGLAVLAVAVTVLVRRRQASPASTASTVPAARKEP